MNLNLKIIVFMKLKFKKKFCNEFEFERKVSKIDGYIQPYLWLLIQWPRCLRNELETINYVHRSFWSQNSVFKNAVSFALLDAVSNVYNRRFSKREYESVDGVMVSIGAFQALVPGSIPGRRIFVSLNSTLLHPKRCFVCSLISCQILVCKLESL